MYTFKQTAEQFEQFLRANLPFPENPETLYAPCKYILNLGGKRIRPSVCLMANELFSPIIKDTFWVAAAIEIFHNFTLVHDDIMDNAPLRRGRPTVHTIYNTNSAILSGDVMNIYAYDCLSRINPEKLPEIFHLFNKTAIEVCEGQQLDMDYESLTDVSIQDYITMITLKTSVLLATSMKSGAIMAGAPQNQADAIYEFGKNLGIAFQLQDDYLDTFGESARTGKQVGGDITENKKTILLIQALNNATGTQTQRLHELLASNKNDKVPQTIALFKELEIDVFCRHEIHYYFNKAIGSLASLEVSEEKKIPFNDLLDFLFKRDH